MSDILVAHATRVLTVAVLAQGESGDLHRAAARLRDLEMIMRTEVDNLPPKQPPPDSYLAADIASDPAHRLIRFGAPFNPLTMTCWYCNAPEEPVGDGKEVLLHTRSCLWARLAYSLGYAQEDQGDLRIRPFGRVAT